MPHFYRRCREEFRDDLGLMCFADIEPSTGMLVALPMTPKQIKNFRLNRPSRADVLRMKDTLNREGRPIGTGVDLMGENRLILK